MATRQTLESEAPVRYEWRAGLFRGEVECETIAEARKAGLTWLLRTWQEEGGKGKPPIDLMRKRLKIRVLRSGSMN